MTVVAVVFIYSHTASLFMPTLCILHILMEYIMTVRCTTPSFLQTEILNHDKYLLRYGRVFLTVYSKRKQWWYLISLAMYRLKRPLASHKHFSPFHSALCCTKAHLHPILCLMSTHHLHQLRVFKICILAKKSRRVWRCQLGRGTKSGGDTELYQIPQLTEMGFAPAFCTNIFELSKQTNAVKPHQFMYTALVWSLSWFVTPITFFTYLLYIVRTNIPFSSVLFSPTFSNNKIVPHTLQVSIF